MAPTSVPNVLSLNGYRAQKAEAERRVGDRLFYEAADGTTGSAPYTRQEAVVPRASPTRYLGEPTSYDPNQSESGSVDRITRSRDSHPVGGLELEIAHTSESIGLMKPEHQATLQVLNSRTPTSPYDPGNPKNKPYEGADSVRGLPLTPKKEDNYKRAA